MQLTINLPDLLSKEKTSQLIREIENILLSEGISYEIIPQSSIEDDSWDNLNISEIAIDTGIEDFAENHDYYLYGISKKSSQ